MADDAFLSVRGLGRRFPRGRGPERTAGWAFRGVSLDLAQGRTLGLVGPSGGGKSTLARCLALYDAPTCGEVRLEQRSLWAAGRRERRRLRAEIQLIFQQPAAALNPRFTAGQIVAEPLLIQRRGDAESQRKRAAELMEMAGLPAGAARNRALEFSGGERQRLAIARALALDPKLLILDESLSGLDVSIQAQIVNLLADLQERLHLTYILISHDLRLVAGIAGEIAVMDGGSIVESGPADELLARPRHPCTRELLDAALALTPGGGP